MKLPPVSHIMAISGCLDEGSSSEFSDSEMPPWSAVSPMHLDLASVREGMLIGT